MKNTLVILLTEAGGIGWTAVKWTLLGAFAGAVLGVMIFLIVRSLGGFRLEVRGAKWWRVLACVLTVVASVFAVGFAGFCEGVWRGTQAFVYTSLVGQNLTPRAGEAGTLLLTWVYYAAPTLELARQEMLPEAQIAEEVKAFEAGARDMDVPELQRRLGLVTDDVVNVAAQHLVAEAGKRWPSLATGRGSKVLNWLLLEMGRGLVHKKLKSELNRFGLAAYWEEVLAGLPAAAAQQGNPKAISYQELSTHLGRQGIAPFLLKPVRGFVRAQQLQAAIIPVIVPVLIVVVIRTGDIMRRRRVQAATTGVSK